MVARAKNTKQRLMMATIELASRGGNQAATIPAIARAAGITEGAIYRHYRSKDELRWNAYRWVVEDMAEEKQEILVSGLPLPEKIACWVKVTYEYFDRSPDAFAFVLLTPHPKLRSESQHELMHRQGNLFMEMFEQARRLGLTRDITPAVALSHFTGLMLNVPRLIREGVLQGPAVLYSQEVADCIWRVFKPADPVDIGR